MLPKTYLVVARYALDDIPIGTRQTLRAAKALAKRLAKRPIDREARVSIACKAFSIDATEPAISIAVYTLEPDRFVDVWILPSPKKT